MITKSESFITPSPGTSSEPIRGYQALDRLWLECGGARAAPVFSRDISQCTMGK